MDKIICNSEDELKRVVEVIEHSRLAESYSIEKQTPEYGPDRKPFIVALNPQQSTVSFEAITPQAETIIYNEINKVLNKMRGKIGTYRVTIYASTDIYVEAENKGDACKKALNQSDITYIVDYAEAKKMKGENNHE